MATAEQALAHELKTARDDPRLQAGADTPRRVQRLVGIFRLLLALALLGVGALHEDLALLGTQLPRLFFISALSYAAIAALVLAGKYRSLSAARRMLPVEIAADIACVTLLMHASGGISSGIGGLLVVFIGAASLSLRGQYAFLAAAIATLAVLAQQAVAFSTGMTPADAFMPAGFLGAVIFAIALAAHPLARRLHESEALAHQRGIDLANLAQLNEYIIQNLRESIVVVDEQDNIRLINQSAADHLGADSRDPGQALGEVSADLQRLVTSWRAGRAAFNTMSGFLSADGSTPINTYIAPLTSREDGPVLIFLEDAGLLAEKVQQTKLAALGRLSASIAHEIRNPVGALSHAGQLLQESPSVGGGERRLLDIISENSRRVSEIVDNVLQLSRREETRPELISLNDWVSEFAAEFTSTSELDDSVIDIAPAEELEVRMDPTHLRQICWNLCENAVVYGANHGDGPRIDIRFGRLASNRRPYLEVADHGPGIPAGMQEQLFEPFATGRAGGTGLGLFISRELCECNRAALLYEPRDGGGSVFRIVFADPDRWGNRP